MGRESRLLLAKIYFATGELEDSLNMYQQTNLDQFVVDAAHSHLVRMLAEAYAIYGMCLEKIMPQRDDRHGPVRRRLGCQTRVKECADGRTDENASIPLFNIYSFI